MQRMEPCWRLSGTHPDISSSFNPGNREIARFLSGQTTNGRTDRTNCLTLLPPTRRGVIISILTAIHREKSLVTLEDKGIT